MNSSHQTQSHGEESGSGFLFTGWESDRFVRFAESLLSQGFFADARVVGREPITTTDVEFFGKVREAIWDGYSRKIVVETPDGITYQVGGTNSTRPIASETVTFFNIPETLELFKFIELDFNQLLDLIQQQTLDLPFATQALRIKVRQENSVLEEKATIAAALIPQIFRANDIVKREIAEVLGILEIPDVLEPLVEMLTTKNPVVRQEVALRFRGLETVIKGVGEGSPIGQKCINGLALALSDQDDSVRIYSAEALGYFYNENAIKALVTTLQTDTNPHVRWSSVIALGRTNRVEVIDHLLHALKTDTSIPVQQGALLGLGRIGGKEITEHLTTSTPRLVKIICDKLSGPSVDVQDYAAYALGEMSELGSDCLDELINGLKPEKPFQVKSNVTLSLTKLLIFNKKDSETKELIRFYLSENLTAARPSGWPHSAYFNWFLVGAAELAALLEFHHLAHVFYFKAHEAFLSIKWLSTYYEGISNYELAENFCVIGELGNAIEVLDLAIDLFAKVKTLDDFRKQSREDQSGLEFKEILAKARKNILEAAIRWQVAFSQIEYQEIKELFEGALLLYKRIDILGIAKKGKKLTDEEVKLVSGLQRITHIGSKLMELRIMLPEYTKERTEALLGDVRQSITALSNDVRKTRSDSLKIISVELSRLVRESYIDQPHLPLVEVVHKFVDSAKDIFVFSLPTPGNCPVIDFGSASMQVELRDSLSGDGTRDNPYLIPADKHLIFEFVVNVNKRTKFDKLLFRALDPPKNARETVQEIRAHESQYSVRPVDFGEIAPSKVPSAYTFVLEFRNQGCSQPAQILEIWVRMYDPKSEFTKYQDRVNEREKHLETQIQFLIADYNDTMRIIRKMGEKTSLEHKQRKRLLEVSIEKARKELEGIGL